MTTPNWTNKENIFAYKYLIIPINQDWHWKLAIVHNREVESDVINLSQDDDDKKELGNCIMIFDSLYTTSNVAGKIRSYLKGTWDLKYPKRKRVFDKNTFPKFTMKVPTQENYSDCGVFLLHYVEKFCTMNFRNTNQVTSDWFPLDQIAKKREVMQNIILDLRKQENNI